MDRSTGLESTVAREYKEAHPELPPAQAGGLLSRISDSLSGWVPAHQPLSRQANPPHFASLEQQVALDYAEDVDSSVPTLTGAFTESDRHASPIRLLTTTPAGTPSAESEPILWVGDRMQGFLSSWRTRLTGDQAPIAAPAIPSAYVPTPYYSTTGTNPVILAPNPKGLTGTPAGTPTDEALKQRERLEATRFPTAGAAAI
eukprot:TRINITY_DN10321_c0_g1_i1.p1 TRINITY_DN10321_c0_g1~~TRINITY_DN10321_c0_g1_i1.p1  ORF type:complete len:201 (-),score=62.63 TRINITY_DN10321_c0_g1_i1:124-726(-)